MATKLDASDLLELDAAELPSALDRVLAARVEGRARISLAITVQRATAGAELLLQFDGGIATPGFLAQAVFAASGVRAVLAWAASRGAQVHAALGHDWDDATFEVRARAVLALLEGAPRRITIARGEPASERGEAPEYGQPNIALQLEAHGLAIRASIALTLVPVDAYAEVCADYLARGAALAAALGVPSDII